MGKRIRAVITRIQTMRTSSLVGLAVTIGLLVVYHFKQSEYEGRMNEKREREEQEFLQNLQLQNEINPELHPLIPIVDDTDRPIQELTESTTPDSEILEGDNDHEQDGKDYSEDGDDNGDDGYDEEDNYDDEENDDDSKVDDYDDDEEEDDVNELDDDGDEEDFGDDDDENSNDEEDTEDYDNDEEDDDYDDMEKNVIDKDDGYEDVDDDDELDEDTDDIDDGDEYEEEDIEDSENNTTPTPIESDDDMEENNADDSAEIDATIGDGSDDEEDDNKDGGYSTNAAFENHIDQGQIIPQKLSREDQEILQKDLEKLAEKYPDTMEDSSLKTQSDNYIVRLRNKLQQVGRLDVIYKNHCTKRLPQSIIIGVMKCGTEAFSTFLGIHPQIAMQFGYTAMDFFSNPALYKKGLDWYQSRMMCSNPAQITMEKSPQYFSAMAAPERIYKMDPKIKIILLVRDPISRAVSHFLQQQKSHPERLTAPTFEDSVYDWERKQVIGSSPYIFQSSYSIIYRRWLKHFSSRQILVIDGDTFKNNPFRSMAKVEKFLNIERYIDETRLSYNKEKGFYCLHPQSDDPEDIAMSCLQGGKGRSHPDIKPEVLNALREYFRPFNEEFIRLTGMRFDW